MRACHVFDTHAGLFSKGCSLGVMQALAEQRVQVESGMNSYGPEVQQASLTVLAWQAHMAALHATTRCSSLTCLEAIYEKRLCKGIFARAQASYVGNAGLTGLFDQLLCVCRSLLWHMWETSKSERLHLIAKHESSLVGHCRSSEALLTKQAAALVRGVDLAAGLRNRLHLLLDLHAAAAVPVTQQALALFVSSICLVKVSHPLLFHFSTDCLTLPTKLSTGSMQMM